VCATRAGKSLSVSPANIRRRLKALVQDRNTPQKHVWRAEIVLLTADGCLALAGTLTEEGFDGLLRAKTRPSRIEPLGAEGAGRVVALTFGEPPGETTH
jgi:hypothetical protein